MLDSISWTPLAGLMGLDFWLVLYRSQPLITFSIYERANVLNSVASEMDIHF